MRLVRTGTNKFEKDHDAVRYFFSDGKIGFEFKQFGLGSERRGKYRVDVSWSDVLNLMARFVEVGVEEAIDLDKSLGLVAAVKNQGWEKVRPAKRRRP